MKRPLPTWRAVAGILSYRPGLNSLTTMVALLLWGVIPQAMALLIKTFFDALEGSVTAGWNAATVVLLVVIVAMAQAVVSMVEQLIYYPLRFGTTALLRKNLFERVLSRPGARAVPGSPGEATSRMGDDVDEVANFCAEMPGLLAEPFLTVSAIVIMVRIDPRITAIVFLPLVVVVVLSNRAMAKLQANRERSREAAAQLQGLIGEAFGAVQAVQVAGAEARVALHLRVLNENRRKTALRDRLFRDLLRSIYDNTANLGTGAILLLAGSALRSGTFTVGDLALFVFYLKYVTHFIAEIGTRVAWYRQAGVSVDRLVTLLQGAPPADLVRHGEVHLRGSQPTTPWVPRTAEHRLETLDCRGLTYRYTDTGRGVRDISFTIRRGSFTVITGRVGSGKTTLVRVLLGLLPRDAGEVSWNGARVEDPSVFFVPPRSAYTPQVPLLYSESLRENILQGLPGDRVDLPGAIRMAALEEDIRSLDRGLDTPVGVKGVRLSGGQVQRVAAARMLVRDAELMVVDDLSSALDVDTERQIWDRLDARRAGDRAQTFLVISHRREVLRRADTILVLKEGAVEAQGGLTELLLTCAEMQRLWSEDHPHAARHDGAL